MEVNLPVLSIAENPEVERDHVLQMLKQDRVAGRWTGFGQRIEELLGSAVSHRELGDQRKFGDKAVPTRPDTTLSGWRARR